MRPDALLALAANAGSFSDRPRQNQLTAISSSSFGISPLIVSQPGVRSSAAHSLYVLLFTFGARSHILRLNKGFTDLSSDFGRQVLFRPVAKTFLV